MRTKTGNLIFLSHFVVEVYTLCHFIYVLHNYHVLSLCCLLVLFRFYF